jgi:ABC-type phosphate transport system substrate-binding protein
MKRSSVLCVTALAVGLGLLRAPLAVADTVVVVSHGSATSSLTKDQVADIYLSKSLALPGGATAVPVDLPQGNATRTDFYEKAAGKNDEQMRAYWARLVFSGRAHQPKQAASADEVKKLVAANPNAVGYLDKSAVDGTVKVVLTLP